MHDTARKAGAAFFEAYLENFEGCRILDIGSMDVNGSLRSNAPSEVEYIGVDIEPGPGVDVVYKIEDGIPVADNTVDICVSTSCFEHDPVFWQTFLRIMDTLKPGGFFYLNAPSNGPYHTYPYDNWRFYPDAGLALAAWARANGRSVELVESGILKRDGDVWNDFVAVFKKTDSGPEPRQHYLLNAFPDAFNVRIGSEMRSLSGSTEDISLLEESRSNADSYARLLRQSSTEINILSEKVIELKLRIQLAHREIAVLRDEGEQGRQRTDHATKRMELAERRTDDFERLATSLELKLEGVTNSTSWKWTAPLRAAAQIVRSVTQS
ncbi:methyltransferase domain-containing protein [Phyllobacterium bourgognense]|uniref:Methyltransferase family protein n=1 Tax=Phyllobacterium bourgognense TaxID=314236 RepID=A0A368YVE7_9HYPH|nr:methyltransferase domain-containing protein [Phyllobacterium bourgognense]RCW83589.1 methyltransferase family protein [Phyllobacterium bourgognense]